MANGYYQKIEERLQNRTREWYQDPSETEENKIRIYGWKQHKNLSEDGKEQPVENTKDYSIMLENKSRLQIKTDWCFLAVQEFFQIYINLFLRDFCFRWWSKNFKSFCFNIKMGNRFFYKVEFLNFWISVLRDFLEISICE